MRLSIIIPIYNVEDTLQRCLESVLTQMDERIEVILIDDGSTDSSGKIAEDMTLTRGIVDLSTKKTRVFRQQETQE